MSLNNYHFKTLRQTVYLAHEEMGFVKLLPKIYLKRDNLCVKVLQLIHIDVHCNVERSTLVANLKS